ncbi:MAG: response regulator [Chloroflexi bacterium]|nr:response regulator [Chloroflexota bacterium]
MSRDARSPRVLVVDDDQDMRYAIAAALRDEGFVVDAAANGTEALHLAGREAPDVLVLDVTLPGLDSSEVSARLRALRQPELPVLVITADGHAREKARQLGAYAYLHKPFDLLRLIDQVRRATG